MPLKRGLARSCMVETFTCLEAVTASWATSKSPTMKQPQKPTIFQQPQRLWQLLSLVNVASLTLSKSGLVAARVRIYESKQSFRRFKSETQYSKRRRRLNLRMTSTPYQMVKHLRLRWTKQCQGRRLPLKQLVLTLQTWQRSNESWPTGRSIWLGLPIRLLPWSRAFFQREIQSYFSHTRLSLGRSDLCQLIYHGLFSITKTSWSHIARQASKWPIQLTPTTASLIPWKWQDSSMSLDQTGMSLGPDYSSKVGSKI